MSWKRQKQSNKKTMVFYFVMTVVEVKIHFLKRRKYYHIKVLQIENVLVTSKCIFFKMFKFSFDVYNLTFCVSYQWIVKICKL
jgi:hypothetical protein